MIQTTTLKLAIAEVFDLDGRSIPEFTSSKPLKEARAWLDREGIKYNYVRGAKQNGVFVFTRGAGSPQFAVVTDETDTTGGLLALATLSPKYKSKSEQRRHEAQEASQVQGDDVESAPTITNSPEDQADTEMTVTDPTPKKRTSRRKK